MQKFTANKLQQALKLLLIWCLVFTLLLILVPFKLLNEELALYVEAYASFIYLALILELATFIALYIYKKVSLAQDRQQSLDINNYMQEQVQALDFAERALLREFVLQRKSVLTVPHDEPTVRSLLESQIIIDISDVDEQGKLEIMISKYARPYITYRAIGLTKSKMSEQMLEQVMAARPSYARQKKVMPRSYKGQGMISA